MIYDASGLILTNAHVVSGARTVQVRLAEGRQLEGRILGADPGFDVAVDTVQRIAPQLVQDGRVTRSGQPYLGLGLADLPGAQGGVQVGSVASGSAAGSAGVQVGDVITAVDGRTVLSRDDLLQALLSRKPGDVVKLTVERAGQPLTVDVTLGEAPAR